MKEKVIAILIVLALSMFCGFIVIATGMGTLTSPLNRIAGPMVCGEKEFIIEQDTSVYIPGEETTRVTAYCVDPETAAKQDVSLDVMRRIQLLQLVTGCISGLVIFSLAMLFLLWAARRLNTPFEKLFQPSVSRK